MSGVAKNEAHSHGEQHLMEELRGTMKSNNHSIVAATPTKLRTPSPTRRKNGSPRTCSATKHNHGYVNTYQYFQKVIDPLISACVAKFLLIQPRPITQALRLYFEAMKHDGVVRDDVFVGLACEDPKKNEKLYFTAISSSIDLLVASISETQPNDVDLIDYILSHDLLKQDSIFTTSSSSSSDRKSPAAQPLQSTSAHPVTDQSQQTSFSHLPLFNHLPLSNTVNEPVAVMTSINASITDSVDVSAIGSVLVSEGAVAGSTSIRGPVLRLYSDDMSSVGMMSTTHPSHPQLYTNRCVPLAVPCHVTMWYTLLFIPIV